MAGPEDNPYDDCKTCMNHGFVRDKNGLVFPCPDCNPDGAPDGEADCDNY